MPRCRPNTVRSIFSYSESKKIRNTDPDSYLVIKNVTQKKTEKQKKEKYFCSLRKLLLQLKFLIHVHSNINFLILNFLQNRLVWYAVQSILVKHKILIQAHYSFIFPCCIQINNDHALSWSFQPPSKDLQFYELFESDQLVLF